MTLNSRLARLEERQVEPERDEAEAEAARAELERRLLGPAPDGVVGDLRALTDEERQAAPKLLG